MVKIAVLGCGLMGVKIAGEMAYHGHRVKMYDSNTNQLNSVYERIEEDKRHLRREGLMSHRNFIGQVLCMSLLEETVNDADFIFEAVVDDLKVKQDIFERVSHCCTSNAIIASNTLNLDMGQIVERTAYKERTLGLRFLFPVYYIPEVEITPGKHTSAEVIEKVRILLEKMGKTLFFRSGGEPLILSEEQREARKLARIQQIKNQSGLGYFFESAIPALGHRGNFAPPQDDDTASYVMEGTDRDCAICMDHTRDCLLCPCHHMVTCQDCARLLLNRRDSCPICRKEITEVIKVYHS
ncbi:peroxisomal fatty acid beta-oxidation multifunctional protein AIM1-like [Lingula anatina]|uniref:Peroxisomal fatty acid beta-oxidation multifunctional protein AIM1-like n=1 Tax=Lingula anatina TaxID=7574 RepID=A0A1S3ICF4_LINAN|nr:peroxisomal fatty acid beta-oxidation multifunctional protein AIM1-like [Lingula anatina]|eukprot:XP_013395922.1 peroxisomal fatty acid beta-oxidation multifunctional protein AIM1-like [Lingula anatina]